MKAHIIVSNYCKYGLTAELAELCESDELMEVRQLERELAESFKDYFVETRERHANAVEVRQVTVISDKEKRSGDYIPRAVRLTYVGMDSDEPKELRQAFSVLVESFRAERPNYERALARYQKSVLIDGERVYREVIDGDAFYVAQQFPMLPSSDTHISSLRESAYLWEDTIKKLVDTLTFRQRLRSGEESGDALDFSCMFDCGDASEISGDVSLVPKDAVENLRAGFGAISGKKGLVYDSYTWHVWHVKAEESYRDRWAEYFDAEV